MNPYENLCLSGLHFKEIKKDAEIIKKITKDILNCEESIVQAAEAKQYHSDKPQYIVLFTSKNIIIIRFPHALKDPSDTKFSSENIHTDYFFFPYKTITDIAITDSGYKINDSLHFTTKSHKVISLNIETPQLFWIAKHIREKIS